MPCRHRRRRRGRRRPRRSAERGSQHLGAPAGGRSGLSVRRGDAGGHPQRLDVRRDGPRLGLRVGGRRRDCGDRAALRHRDPGRRARPARQGRRWLLGRQRQQCDARLPQRFRPLGRPGQRRLVVGGGPALLPARGGRRRRRRLARHRRPGADPPLHRREPAPGHARVPGRLRAGRSRDRRGPQRAGCRGSGVAARQPGRWCTAEHRDHVSRAGPPAPQPRDPGGRHRRPRRADRRPCPRGRPHVGRANRRGRHRARRGRDREPDDPPALRHRAGQAARAWVATCATTRCSSRPGRRMPTPSGGSRLHCRRSWRAALPGLMFRIRSI